MQQPAEDPFDYISGPEGGSLLIYERICPFAAPDPIMSRRVFDVGLDIGRIKNGIQRRQENKRTRSGRSASASEANHEKSGGNQQLIPRMPRKKSHTKILNIEHQEPAPLPSSGSSGKVTIAEDIPKPAVSPKEAPMPSEPEPNTQTDLLPLSSSQGEDSAPLNFDLNPPAPRKSVKMLDSLSERIFSPEHLRVILRDPTFFMRFTAFLNRYKTECSPLLVRYLEAQKAIKAVEYANALAESMKPISGDETNDVPCTAATIDARFEQRSQRAFDTLVNEALPAYVTFYLVKVVTESMVREITGTALPLMRELVGGLAEVFCLADPSLPDTPIVYASEEFYRSTQYGRDYVIGKNCRFLQGPKSNRHAAERIGAAIKGGQEATETILNYRRGGEPFMNLLMTAPLFDNRGNVRYIIGAQVDVSGLIEEGRGLDSFERTLNDRSSYNKNPENTRDEDDTSKKSLKKLDEFGQMLSLDEGSVFDRSQSRNSSVNDGVRSEIDSVRAMSKRDREYGPKQARKMLGHEEEQQSEGWALSLSSPSGKLPGVYQNYLLVRPFPSMRIIFVSPTLRIPGLLQSPFLSRIGGPGHVREGLSEAFESGESVTAKITWLPTGRSEENDYSRSSSRGGSDSGRTRYISCTPLLGSDDRVGVWMVVMVEHEQVTGSLQSRMRPRIEDRNGAEIRSRGSDYEREPTNGNMRQITHTTSTSQQRSEPRMPRTPKDRPTTATPSSNTNGYTYSAPTIGPGKLSGESGRLYNDFIRGQQTPIPPLKAPNPYGHRANEGYTPQQYQRQQSNGVVGPGKVVSLESDNEDSEPNGLVDGLASPKLNGVSGEKV